MTKKEIYTKCLYLYGFMTLLCLIEDYIEQENYEECQIILDVIKDHNKYLGHDLPTELNEQSFEYFQKAREEFKISDKSLLNITLYAEEIKDLLKNNDL